MTYGNEPRRRGRPSDSSRRGNGDDEAEDWLAGYRPAPEDRRDDDRRGRDDDRFGRGHRDDTGDWGDQYRSAANGPPRGAHAGPRPGGPGWEEPGWGGEPPRSSPQPRRASGAEPFQRPMTGPGNGAEPFHRPGTGPGNGADPRGPRHGPPADATGVFPSGPTSGPPIGSTGGLPRAGSTGTFPDVDRGWIRPQGPGAAPPPVPGPVPPPYPPPVTRPVSPPYPPVSPAPRPPRPSPGAAYGRRPDTGYVQPSGFRAEPSGFHAEPVAPRIDPTEPWVDPEIHRPAIPERRPAGRRGSREPADPGDPHRRRSRLWTIALSTVGALVLLVACGLGTYLVVKDERSGPASARTSNQPSAQQRNISTREADPAPLTEAEVFPKPTIVAAPNEPPYQVLKTQVSADCKVAATDDLGNLLIQGGCSQVVRATLKSPNGNYLITSGIFNLKDEAGASQAHESIRGIIDAQKGRFTGLLAGPGTEAIVRAPAHLGWNIKGHFLAYCVIARTDGKPFAAGDAFPQQIIFDLVETHLRDGIIGARTVVGPPNPAGPKPSG